MQFDVASMKLTFDTAKIKNEGTFKVTFTLTDSRGASSNVDLAVKVIKPILPPPQIAVAPLVPKVELKLPP